MESEGRVCGAAGGPGRALRRKSPAGLILELALSFVPGLVLGPGFRRQAQARSAPFFDRI